MTKHLKSKSLIICVIISLIVASFVTFTFYQNSKQRFFKKLEITNIFSQDLIIVQKLKIALGFPDYDPFISKLNIFSSTLNYLSYDQNSDCGKISAINNIVPIVITVKEPNSIFLEIVGENKNTFDSCVNLILDEVKKENLKIVEFYNELISQFINTKNQVKTMDDFIVLYNKFRNQANIKIDLDNQSLIFLYNMFLSTSEPSGNNYFPNLSVISVDQLEYWRVFMRDHRIEKSVNLYIIFSSSFVLIFVILLQVYNRRLIIYSLKKFFN